MARRRKSWRRKPVGKTTVPSSIEISLGRHNLNVSKSQLKALLNYQPVTVGNYLLVPGRLSKIQVFLKCSGFNKPCGIVKYDPKANGFFVVHNTYK